MKKLIFPLLIMVFVVGCQDDDNEHIDEKSSITFQFAHGSDGVPLSFDTLLYQNMAGNKYSVTRLQYYVSQVALIKADSQKIVLKDYYYIDANVSSTITFQASNIPHGNYIGLSLNIGLDTSLNKTGALPVIPENINMEWPDMMGGGYHFMKLEGHFLNNDTLYGYAMHLGNNKNLVRVVIYSPLSLYSDATYKLLMNLNEWFKNPHTYDFNIDGNYSMGDSVAMRKLSQNGVDILTRQ
jgi:hypothetical protein